MTHTHCVRCFASLLPPVDGVQRCAPCNLVWLGGRLLDEDRMLAAPVRGERGWAHWAMRGGSRYTGLVHGVVMTLAIAVLWPAAPIVVRAMLGGAGLFHIAHNLWALKTGRLDHLG
jgi:hypothetical protein